MAGYSRIPDLLSRVTQRHLEHRLNEVEYQVAPNADVDPNEDEHVALAGRREYSKILK